MHYMVLPYAALTDVGHQREHNEDSLLVMPERNLFGVFDGVGGHADGEVASSLAASVVLDAVSRRLSLTDALIVAHRRISERSVTSIGKPAMATTAVVVHLRWRFYRYAWAGDSRLYCLDAPRHGIRCLTRDHSFVQQQIDAGVLSPEEAKGHPMAHLLTQSLGISRSGELQPGRGSGWLRPGQWLLLCSDGLSSYVPEETWLASLAHRPEPGRFARSLIDQANQAGGHDNVSIVVIKG
jgi:protein phosphatase